MPEPTDVRPTTNPQIAPITMATIFWRLSRWNGASLDAAADERLDAKPMPPSDQRGADELAIVDSVASENELAICTPTSDSGAEPASIHSASGTCTLPS